MTVRINYQLCAGWEALDKQRLFGKTVWNIINMIVVH